MPERVTPEERLISLAIEKARKAKELLSDPNGLDFTEDEKLEMEKVKRPKAEKVTTKIPNQEKEGYGLAGQEIKKNDFYDTLLDHIQSLSMDVEDLKKLDDKLESYKNLSPERKEGIFNFYNGEVRNIKAHIDNINKFRNGFEELPKSFLE